MEAFQGDAYQADAFQVLELAGTIAQTAPSFTQSLTGTSSAVVVPEEPGHGGGVFLGPGFLQRPVRGRITQTAPAFTQHLTAEVNDDELVLLLMI